MRNGEHADCRVSFQVDDVVGKTLHRNSSDGQVSGHSGDWRAGTRKGDGLADSGVHRIEELKAESRSTPFIPPTGVAVFRVSLILESNAGVHRFCNSASARRRTSSHGVPDDSPAITRRARFSISSAHAASTSAMSSVGASSRLARSSAATSARWLIGRVSASRSSSCARSGMAPFYIRARQPNIALEPSAPTRT